MDTITNQIFELQYALDTFYFLVMAALAMWAVAGFSILHAGLIGTKNTTDILTRNILLLAIACTAYMTVGYDIMYDDGLFLEGIASNDTLTADALAASAVVGFDGSAVYSKASGFFFQVILVVIVMLIVSGALATRITIGTFVVFTIVMTSFIYPIEGYWTWGGGDVLGMYNLGDLGFLDFAGSGIVHLAGASAALAGMILLNACKVKYDLNNEKPLIQKTHLSMATLGLFILWLAWFGLNGGSVLKLADMASSNTVATVFLNTNAAAAGGVIAAFIVTQLLFGKINLTLILNGALAGLVAITAGPETPTPLIATMIGAVSAVLVLLSIVTLNKIKFDDPVSAISVHGVAGLWGLCAVPLTNPDASLIAQLIGAATIFVWVFVTSFIVWLVAKLVIRNTYRSKKPNW